MSGCAGRFFAFLATYQAKRLRVLTDQFSSDRARGRRAAPRQRCRSTRSFANPAYMGIFRKFIVRRRPTAGRQAAGAQRVRDVARDVRVLDGRAGLPVGAGAAHARRDGRPDLQALRRARRPDAPLVLRQRRGGALKAQGAAAAHRRRTWRRRQGARARRLRRRAAAAVKAIEAQCYSSFLASDHFSYILELKAKEGIIPGLPDFRLIRVLGQGGFGQVLEVVKRDCGKHYAMKVMHKEMMRRCLGSSWRKKIHLEKDLMASLNHPFLVNLSYAFQNTEFLVLVMDLVPAGDLSEFVLTEKRLTAEQIRFVIMEVVCVIGYCHTQNVLYRDLKPENLLIDEQGHVRMIDMGLAARISKKQPKRRSRVGTDCYMAPEVRWAKDRREPYGLSCDWYTVGVLAYEFSAGTVPYARPDEEIRVPATRLQGPRLRALHPRAAQPGPHEAPRLRRGGHLGDPRPPYWKGIEWDLVPLKKFESPCKNVKAPAKKKKDKENLAVQIANDISEAEREEPDQEYQVGNWDFVSTDRRRGGVHGEHVPVRLRHLSAGPRRPTGRRSRRRACM